MLPVEDCWHLWAITTSNRKTLNVMIAASTCTDPLQPTPAANSTALTSWLPSDNGDDDESNVKTFSSFNSSLWKNYQCSKSPRTRGLPGSHGWNLWSSSSWQRRRGSEVHTRQTGSYRGTGAKPSHNHLASNEQHDESQNC
jgi:hypothetical protein